MHQTDEEYCFFLSVTLKVQHSLIEQSIKHLYHGRIKFRGGSPSSIDVIKRVHRKLMFDAFVHFISIFKLHNML